MFLRKQGASKKYTFDVIYSGLQKFLRRGEEKMAIEMSKEFSEFPNALKKRLIQNCTEDCPNYYLINEIHNKKASLDNLIPYIKIICNHMKCREAQNGFRYACTFEHNFEPLTDKDDALTMLIKIRTILANEYNDCGLKIMSIDEMFNVFQQIISDKYKINISLKKIYNFITKNRTFILGLVSFVHNPYMFVTDYEVKPIVIGPFEDIILPDYVYDKHVAKSKNREYKYFMDNIVLIPRMPETEIEKKGRELYLTTNIGTKEYLGPIVEQKITVEGLPVELIQTQLITSKYKPKTYFCHNPKLKKYFPKDIHVNNEYGFILKGPMKKKDIDAILLSHKYKLLFGMITDYPVIVNKDYLLSINHIIINEKEVELKKSKLEHTYIHVGDKHSFHSSMISKMNSEERLKLLKCLLFRKIIGTNDTTDRNMLFVKGEVISIDDPAYFIKTDGLFKKPIAKAYACNYKKSIEESWNNLMKIIDEWSLLESCEFIKNQLDSMKNRDNWK